MGEIKNGARFEKEFEIKSEQEEGKSYKFKIIVDEGQIYLKCIDCFEDIFELSKDIVS